MKTPPIAGGFLLLCFAVFRPSATRAASHCFPGGARYRKKIRSDGSSFRQFSLR
jgi:hypothetical protein